MEPAACDSRDLPDAYSLETLPRDAKILLLKTAGIRRRCMMLCKSFYSLCTHSDYAASTRALTIRARSFRPRHDRVEALVSYIAKTSPYCFDLEFRDCYLPAEIVAEIIASKSIQLQKLTFVNCTITCGDVVKMLQESEFPSLESVMVEHLTQAETREAANWSACQRMSQMAPRLTTLNFVDSSAKLVSLCHMAHFVSKVSYTISDVLKVRNCMALEKQEDGFYCICYLGNTHRNYWIVDDALLTLEGEEQGGDMYCPVESIQPSLKIEIALLQCVEPEDDQIEFVDLNGEPVYIYLEQDLEHFRRIGAIQNAIARGSKHLSIRVFESEAAEDPVLSIWMTADRWQQIHNSPAS